MNLSSNILWITVMGSLALPQGIFASSAKKAKNQTNVVQKKKTKASKKANLSENSKKISTKNQEKSRNDGTKVVEKEPTKRTESNYTLTQMHQLYDAGYPILASIVASKIVASAENLKDDKYNKAWQILYEGVKKRDTDYLVESLAAQLEDKFVDRGPPGFGDNWFYFLGSHYAAVGSDEKAERYFKKLEVNDRYFFPSRYQLGMLAYKSEDFKRAEAHFRAVLIDDKSIEKLSVDSDSLKELKNLSYMALARISYQEKRFQESINFYRKVSRDSIMFYDSLFEQSWAFFMGGYPNHSLGALHSVESPFFNDIFNPEASLLRSVAYYWMCRYDDSRMALADFSDRHGEAVEALGGFLDRQKLSNETAYTLFENMLTGVSSESLGIPISILKSAADGPSMIYLRNQYASVLNEMDVLEKAGIGGQKKGIKTYKELVKPYENELRNKVGAAFLAELKETKSQYDQLYSQAEFLYVELLMSEKEKLLGRELHASTKISRVDLKQRVDGWARKTQSWNQSDKNEYWWDEIGYYVFQVQPMCEQK